MRILLEQCIDEGVFGLSIGLIYPPGCYSSTEEIIELGKVLNEHGLAYFTHIRNGGNNLLESLEEAIKIAKECNIAVEIAHHKSVGKYNWGKVNASLRAMEEARKRGIEITCDVYPYTACSTTITSVLPTWTLNGGITKMLKRLKNKKIREMVRKEINEDSKEGENWIKSVGWAEIVIGECQLNREYEGKSLENILTEKNKQKDIFEVFF